MEIKKYRVEIEGITPLLQHRFPGLEEAKRLKKLSDREQAEGSAYKLPDGTLYIPAEWLQTAFKEAFVRLAPDRKKTEARQFIGSRIRVSPLQISLGTKEYIIDKRSVPSQMGRKATRDFVVRPRLDKWAVTFYIHTPLDKLTVQQTLQEIGYEIGIGANRINGYGRFEIRRLEEE